MPGVTGIGTSMWRWNKGVAIVFIAATDMETKKVVWWLINSCCMYRLDSLHSARLIMILLLFYFVVKNNEHTAILIS